MALTQITEKGIKDGEIVNADINASADIALSKLDTSGTANNGTFLRGDGAWTAVSTDLVADSSPQLGGHLSGNTYNIEMGDSAGTSSGRIYFGASQDLQIYHSSNENIIGAATTGQDIFFKSSASSSLDTTSFVVRTDGSVTHPDNIQMKFGGSDDLKIYHDGTSSYLSNTTGNLYIESKSGQTAIQIVPDGAVDLRHSGSKKIETSSSGATITSDLILNNASGDTALRWADGGTNKFSLYQSSGTLRFYDNTNSAERMRIDSSGNVGIGTTSPNTTLNIKETAVNATALTATTCKQLGLWIEADSVSNTSGEIQTGITFGEGYSGLYSIDAGAGAAQHLAFFSGAAAGVSERMRIDSSGNVGINSDASGPDRLLHVSDSGAGSAVTPFRLTNVAGSSGTEVRMEFECGVDEVAYISAKNEGSDVGPLIFATASSTAAYPTEKMRINKQGDLTIGQSTDDTRLGIKQRNTNVDYIHCRNTSDTLKFYVHSSGNAYNTNNSWGQISDQSLKENIVDAKSQWNDIKNIKIRNFNFTEASGMDTHTQIGCVAQEVETVSPKLVTTPNADGVKAVQTSVLYMKAVKALQEAMAKIEVLETKVAALEAA